MVTFHNNKLARHFIRGALCSVLAVSSLLGLLAPSVAYARPYDKAHCWPDQVLPGGAGEDTFGAGVVVSHLYTPRVPSRICAVRLLLRRNVSGMQAGPVVLTLVAGDETTLLATADVPASAIPEGTADAVTFSFGCDFNGPPTALDYNLMLSSPDSASGAYTWMGSDDQNSQWPMRYVLTNDRIGDAGLPNGYAVQVFTCQ